MLAKRRKCVTKLLFLLPTIWLPHVWDSLTQFTVREREHTNQGFIVGRVFMGIIDSQCLYRKTYGLPSTFWLSEDMPGAGRWEGRISKDICWFCSLLSIDINIFPFQHQFFMLDRIILYIDYRSNEYPNIFLVREVKDAPLANESYVSDFRHLVFYILFLFLGSWLVCKMVSKNFILYLHCSPNTFILKAN